MNTRAWIKLGVLWLAIAFLAPGRSSPAAGNQGGGDYNKIALKAADFILAQQTVDGAIADSPGSEICNEDSNMEYALMGLAAAYSVSHEPKYLNGLAQGIAWLAEREEMKDLEWRGSWHCAYDSRRPYGARTVSPGKGIAAARGVDATSALFVYLLRLHHDLSGTNALTSQYGQNARAALDFVLDHNGTPGGFTYSSWQMPVRGNKWRLWRYQYAADQADVYLGLGAGSELYREERYGKAAGLIASQVESTFFIPALKRYGIGRDQDGHLDHDLNEFDGIFPQGYLPWVFGKTPANLAALSWLQAQEQPDGSLKCYAGDPRFALSVAMYVLGERRLGKLPPAKAISWLAQAVNQSSDGGVCDTAAYGSIKYTNVAGFTAMALVGFQPLLDERSIEPHQ